MTHPLERRRSLLRLATFLALVYGVAWGACFLFRGGAAAGDARSVWSFILITVWSPTIVALLTSLAFDGVSGLSNQLGVLRDAFARNRGWYAVAVLVPSLTITVAVMIARLLHQTAPLIPWQLLPVVAGLQLVTGASGEELGWRGFVLSHLRRWLTERQSAVVMAFFWSLWHLPSFFFPGMPQAAIAPVAFLVAVWGFGTFLALLFYRTGGHVVATMLAHFTLNLGLAVGAAVFGSTLWWVLCALFGFVAALSLMAMKSGPEIYTSNFTP